jgi:GNAT superfamily N-acetyltransferase
MGRMIAINAPEALARWSGATDLPHLDPDDLVRHGADAHWIAVSDAGEAVGRCSIWWSRTPPVPGGRLGIIGHYAARDAAAARHLLDHACRQLAAHGCTMAVGPMDGSTWRRYRLITERGSEAAFFLEPDNPDDWPAHFRDSGFACAAHYTSALTTDLTREDPMVRDLSDRLHARGVTIRPLEPRRLDAELHRIYTIAVISFRDNFLFAPIDEAAFIAHYRTIAPWVRPELVLIAEFGGLPIGFLFAVPDRLQEVRGQTIDTVIIKTIAVLPEHSNAGLGRLLIAKAHQIARGLGHSRVIHALMLETSHSTKISRHYAHTMRRYGLFTRALRNLR